MALEQRYYVWVDAVGLLSVWETDLDCTIIHLLGWRARANNAENLAEGSLYATAQIHSLITNFLQSSMQQFSFQRNTGFLYLSPQIFKRKLISNCLKYNCWLLIYFTSGMLSSKFSIAYFWMDSFVFSSIRLQENFYIYIWALHTYTHTLLKSKFIFIQNI